MKRLGWYLTFEGRVGRAAFWISRLVGWTLIFAVVFVVSVLFGHLPNEHGLATAEEIGPIGITLAAMMTLAIIWSATCFEIKRWHDRNKSGWWYWIALVPIIGGIWVLVECGFKRGTAGPNRFGPDPLT